MTEKTCTKCGETKPFDSFRIDRSKRSGRKQPCQQCNVAISQIWQRGDSKKAVEWRERERVRVKLTQPRQRKQLRKETLEAYGNRCACCGETTPEFLTIDHVANDGAKHRKEIGSRIYEWLKENGFPKSNFQLLCFNCNCTKGIYGECPHRKTLSKAT